MSNMLFTLINWDQIQIPFQLLHNLSTSASQKYKPSSVFTEPLRKSSSFIGAPGNSWWKNFLKSRSESLVLLNSSEEAWHTRKVPRQTKHSGFPSQEEEGREGKQGGGHVTLSFQGRRELNHSDSNLKPQDEWRTTTDGVEAVPVFQRWCRRSICGALSARRGQTGTLTGREHGNQDIPYRPGARDMCMKLPIRSQHSVYSGSKRTRDPK